MQKQRNQFIKANRLQKETTASYRHTESLNYFYFVGQGLTADTHAQKPSEKEKKIKEPPFRAGPGRAAGLGRVSARMAPNLAAAHPRSSDQLRSRHVPSTPCQTQT